MDLSRAEELIRELSDIVDYPLFNESPRISLSATLAVSSLQFAAATRALCANGFLLGAGATLRSQFEAIVRSVWTLHRATDRSARRR